MTQGTEITDISGAYSSLSRGSVFIGGDVYTRPSFGKNHPLSYTRQGAVVELCDALGWLSTEVCRNAPQADVTTLERLHTPDYIAALQSASDRGKVTAEERSRFRFGTMENPVFKGLFERAASTVGGSMLAARIALGGKVAFHPAGGTHHGRPDRASGFCYFNDPAFAVLAFLDAGLERVAYVDVDAHHGDGVFDAFAGDSRVACVSIHEDKRWPHTGTVEEQSAQTLNIPLPWGANDAEYHAAIQRLVLPFLNEFSPQAIVLTCGADALAGDPLSRMELSNHALWRAVTELVAQTPTAVVLGGGGYNPWTTVRCWSGLWGLLSGKNLPETLPERARILLASFTSDLVEEDEIEPHWLDTLADPPTHATIRAEVEELIASLERVHSL